MHTIFVLNNYLYIYTYKLHSSTKKKKVYFFKKNIFVYIFCIIPFVHLGKFFKRI